MNSNDLLNIAGVIVGSYTNGPGKRVALWVQGCTIGCEGCYNRELQPHVPKHLVDPEKFAEQLISVAKSNGCEGITISGGEPFQQSKCLKMLTSIVRKSGLSVVCFTGYTLEKIAESNDHNISGLKDNLDILISGSFQKCHNHQYKWYDQTDKSIIFITDRYSKLDFKNNISHELIIKGNQVYRTGFMDDLTIYDDLF